MNDIFEYILLFFAGTAAGFINLMAGGASLITIGTMILLGVEPSVANGTNRIGVLVGAGSGALAFKTSKITEFKQSLLYGACAIPGAIVGSFFSIHLSDAIFQRVLAVIMILIMVSMFIPQKKKTEQIKPSVWIYPAMFLVGLYGGFIQAGVGFLLMFTLRYLLVLDLVKTNMHKTFVVLIYTLPVLLVFGLNDKINWKFALILSAGNALGAWFSAKLAIKKGEKIIKIILSVAIVLMAVKLFVG